MKEDQVISLIQHVRKCHRCQDSVDVVNYGLGHLSVYLGLLSGRQRVKNQGR